MNKMAVKVAFMQSSDCWGCHQSLLNAHLGLLPVLPALDIVYWPAVVDFKLDSLKARPDGDVLVGFVEGSMRTNADVENAKLMRAKCQLIVGFGSCACYGNVHGLANEWDIEEGIKRKFTETESITNESPHEPKEHMPGFTKKIVPLDEVISVDIFMAGCPPKPEAIISAIQYLLGQKPQPMADLSFCNDCSLNNENCLLEKYELCFGPITSIGCTLKCPDNGNPCVGCLGPAKTVSARAEKLKTMTQNMHQLSSGDKKNLLEFLTLFLNVSLMSGFDLAADILKQVRKTGEAQTALANVPADTGDIYSNLMKYMKNNREFIKISTVCDQCDLEIGSKSRMTKVKRDYEGLPNSTDCLIEQGYLCAGPITRAGCGGLCMRVNTPCSGCFGQTAWNVDQAERFADVVTKGFNVALSKEELLAQVKDKLGFMEKFTLATNKNYR
jgi:F420-non-reducing hydrogenase small subunit